MEKLDLLTLFKKYKVRTLAGLLAVSVGGGSVYGYSEYKKAEKAREEAELQAHTHNTENKNNVKDNTNVIDDSNSNVDLPNVTDVFGTETDEDQVVFGADDDLIGHDKDKKEKDKKDKDKKEKDNKVATDKKDTTTNAGAEENNNQEDKKEVSDGNANDSKDKKDDKSSDNKDKKEKDKKDKDKKEKDKKEDKKEEEEKKDDSSENNNEDKKEDEDNKDDSSENNNEDKKEDEDKKDDEDDDKEKKHKHKWSSWKYLDDDEEYRECNKCDEIQTREHSWGDWIYNFETQRDESTCATCGHTKQREHTHTWGPWTYLNDNTEVRVSNDDANVMQLQGHTWGAWTYNPTTDRDESTCATCGHTKQKEHTHSWGACTYVDENTEKRVSKDNPNIFETQGHTWGAWTYNSATGLDESTCSTCHHKRTKTHQEEHTHTWGAWTYVDDNTEQRVCTTDPTHVETQGHTWGAWTYNSSTGLDESTCSTCNHTRTRAHTYTFGEWQDNGANEIRYCVEDPSITETREHSMGAFNYDAASGQDVSECATCSHKEYQTHTFTWSEWQDNGANEIRYSTDGSNLSETRDHSMGEIHYDSSTEQDVSECATCSHKEYQAHNFTWGDWENNGDNEIRNTTDGTNKSETRGHNWANDWSYVNGADQDYCTTCDATRSEEHTRHHWSQTKQKDIRSADVCYEDYQECLDCGLEQTIESHGHTWPENGVFNGETYDFICEKCGVYQDSWGKLDLYHFKEDILRYLKMKEINVIFDEQLLAKDEKVLSKNMKG